MDAAFWVKYTVFLMIVSLVSSSIYGVPLDPLVEDLSTGVSDASGGTGFNPLGLGIINWLIGVETFLISTYFTLVNCIWAGLRMITFDYVGFPEILHYLLGGSTVIMIVFFILDMVHGFI